MNVIFNDDNGSITVELEPGEAALQTVLQRKEEIVDKEINNGLGIATDIRYDNESKRTVRRDYDRSGHSE